MFYDSEKKLVGPFKTLFFSEQKRWNGLHTQAFVDAAQSRGPDTRLHS